MSLYSININNEPHVKLKDVEEEIIKLKSENSRMRYLLTWTLEELEVDDLREEIKEFLK